MNRYLICKMQGGIFSFLMEENKALEVHCDRESTASLIGTICIGRVKDVAENIGAAFVEIAPGQVCYLPFEDLLDPVYLKKGSSETIQQGDELIVQVSRDAIKSKYPSVTSNLTIRGKYVLLITGRNRISCSSKLEKEEKKRLLHLAESISQKQSFSDAPGPLFGWLIRTNAAGIDGAVLSEEMNRLFARYRKILENAEHRLCFYRLSTREPPWISRLLDLYDSYVDSYLTDDRKIYEEAKAFLAENQPIDLPKLSFYSDPLQSMAAHFSLERELQKALSDTVWLDSGAYLIIEPTEALTVIDVNSGKYEGGKDREKAARKVNREAAREAARQIRLRNLSGIILIDFINMKLPEDNEELLSFLEGLIRRDPVKTVLVDMTKLSLVELTRRKKEKPLYELAKND